MNTASLRLFISEHKTELENLGHYKRIKKYLRDHGFSDVTEEQVFIAFGNVKPGCPGFKFISFSVGYRSCKRNCECYKTMISSKIKDIKAEYTPDKIAEINAKRQLTVVEKYGVHNVSLLSEVKTKSKSTKIDKFDHAGYNNRAQAVITSLDRYGTDNPAKSMEIKSKTAQTNLEKYNAITPLQNSTVKEKIKTTMLRKYGVESPAQSRKVQQKMVATTLDKYGVDNPSKIHYSQETLDFLDNADNFQHELDKLSIFELCQKYNVSMTAIYNRIHKYNLVDRVISVFQQNVVSSIKQIYPGEIVINTRTQLAPHEIDIYIPEFKLAIECNGTYWHSELNGRGRDYHLNKSKLAKERGITLLHVWEHQWAQKKHVLVSIIQNKLMKIHKIHARKCSISEISSSTAKQFLDNNHIQGGTNSSCAVGLYFNNELVSVMTFGKSRFNKNYTWELLRFSSKLGHSIVGGASRLFTYFLKKYQTKSIITYSDFSLMSGSVYSHLGFKHQHYSPPSYFYTKDYKTVTHRINFQKKKLASKLNLFDPALTEWQNMQNNGYDRIWDCGNDVWVYQQDNASVS